MNLRVPVLPLQWELTSSHRYYSQLVLKQAKKGGPPLGRTAVVPEGTHRRQDRALETLRWATRVLVGVGRGVLTALEGIFSLTESFLGIASPEA